MNKPDVVPWQSSSLLVIYNGFMLGVFMTLLQFEFARKRFRQLRQPATEFVDRVKLGVSIPGRRSDCVRNYVALHEQIIAATRQKSRLLGASYFLGSASALLAMGTDWSEEEKRTVKDALNDILKGLGTDPMALSDFTEALEPFRDQKRIEVIVSPCLSLLAEIIRQLPDDRVGKYCFIAMPFNTEHERYYRELYVPLAARWNCLPCRAWGGLSREVYLELLFQMIRRSTVIIADVTGLNPNVTYEIGLAHGFGKTVYLLHKGRDFERLSNIGGLMVHSYHPRSRHWPKGSINSLLVKESLVNLAGEIKASGAPNDPEAFWEWREAGGRLRSPEKRQGDSPFRMILPSDD